MSIDVRMQIVNLNLANACTNVRLHIEVTAPSSEYDTAARAASVAADPFDGSGRGGSALPMFLKHQAALRATSCSLQHPLSLVQPLRLSLWLAGVRVARP